MYEGRGTIMPSDRRVDQGGNDSNADDVPDATTS